MNCIQFDINNIPCEIVRLDNGYMLLAKNEEKIFLHSHEIYLWLSGRIEVSDGLSISKSLLNEPKIERVLKFVGVESSRYL
jgi:hypothetical protein